MTVNVYPVSLEPFEFSQLPGLVLQLLVLVIGGNVVQT